MIIKKVRPVSFAKFQAIFFIFLGFIAAFFFGFTTIFTLDSIQDVGTQSSLDGLRTTIWPIAFVVFPILFYIIGFILGLIECWIYNLFASWSGGIEIKTMESFSMEYSDKELNLSGVV